MVEVDAQQSRLVLEDLTGQGLLNREEDASGLRYVIAGDFLQDVIVGRVSLAPESIQKMHARAATALANDTSSMGATGRVIHTLLSGVTDAPTIELAMSAIKEQVERSASAEALCILEHIEIDKVENAEITRFFLEMKADAAQALSRFSEVEKAVSSLLAARPQPMRRRMLSEGGVCWKFSEVLKRKPTVFCYRHSSLCLVKRAH